MLFTQYQAKTSSVNWISTISQQIISRFQPSTNNEAPFPCIFSRKAFRLEIVKFLPVYLNDDKTSYNLKEFADNLRIYLKEICRKQS